MTRRKRIVALKNVTINEAFFAGHFPGFPVMPGVLIVEAMAQAGATLIMTELPDREKKLILFSGIGWLTTTAAFAQTRGEAVTIRFTTFSPFIALLAGILILIMPRLLNYIVAIYLLLIGLIGIFGR